MKFAGRVQAAIEILHDVITRHRPASEALKDWGKSHRFAGSGDRNAIGTLVFDALRQRSISALQGGGDSPRQIVLGLLRNGWGQSVDDIAAIAGEQHGPGALSTAETNALSRPLEDMPRHVAANIPAWLAPQFETVFGAQFVAEGEALARRAPIDLRVNMLKTNRDAVLDALRKFGAVPGPFVETSVRIAAPEPDQKHVNVEVEPCHGMGWFEVQDTASQIAAALTGVKAGENVADICAGAGGKTLALAALMGNKGRLVAHDVDRFRLRPIFERISRSGASCVEVVAADNSSGLATESFDCVVVDAPCSGSGTWRRKPDAKWKLTRRTLDARLTEQRSVLADGAKLVRRGGRLVYFTCSVLAEENTEQVKAFLNANRDFKVLPYQQQWTRHIGTPAPRSADGAQDTLLLSPHQHGVDGFFTAIMERVG